MGWSFRRSIKMGPLRLNATTRSVGLSAGVRGARVSVGPRGTYIALGRGGLQYRAKLGGKRAPSSSSSAQTPRGGAPDGTDSNDAFSATAPAQELALISADASLLDLQERLTRTSLFPVYLGFAGAGAWLVAYTAPPWAIITYAFVGLALTVAFYVWDKERRTARLLYDVDNEEVLERLSIVNVVGESLQRSQGLWHVYHAGTIDDWKRSGGATSLLRRTPVRVAPGTLADVELNIEPWTIAVGPQHVLFLPDRIVVREGRRVAAATYDELDAEASTIQLQEEGAALADATQVGTTWRYINRDGNPDGRFKDNYQIPIMEYGGLVLRSRTGLRVVLLTSARDGADRAAAALEELSRRAGRTSRAAMTAPAPPPVPTPSVPPSAAQTVPEPAQTAVVQPPTTPTPTQTDHREPDMEETAQAVALVLRYVAVADRRIGEAEIELVREFLTGFCGTRADIAAEVSAELRSLSSDTETVTAALTLLQRSSPSAKRDILTAATKLASVDGRVTPKESERLQELHTKLTA